MSRRLLTAATVLLSILPALIGSTQANQRDWNRFRVSLGVFIVDYDTTTRVGTPFGSGTNMPMFDQLVAERAQRLLQVINGRDRYCFRHSVFSVGFPTRPSDSEPPTNRRRPDQRRTRP